MTRSKAQDDTIGDEERNTSKEEKIDFADIGLSEELRHAVHGDLGPLIALLRSDAPIPLSIRNYIADEIEKPRRARFTQRLKGDLKKDRERRRLLKQVDWAKWQIAHEEPSSDVITDENVDAFIKRHDSVSDAAALDYLAKLVT